MKTRYLKNYLVLIGLWSSLLPNLAQIPAKTVELSTNQSGNKTYIARESITLQPGFSYSASSGNQFNGYIDQTLVFPPTENTYADANGNIVGNATQGAMVGNLAGALDVSPSGAATYNIPIDIPAGINGMQPSISLVYNSQAGNGIAGMCWNISGLSMISRVPKNYYYDDETSGIIWDKTSPLALDGQRLIVVNDSWGTDSIEYCTESGLDKIIGYSIGANGPSSFKIYTQDGRILEYGGTDKYLVPIYAGFHLGWIINKVTDTNDNYVKYTYTNTVWKNTNYYGDNRIFQIEYGNGTEKVASVHFQYKNKTSSFSQYIGGIETKNQKILEYIEVKGLNNDLQRTYTLTYNVQDNNEFLTEVKVKNSAEESLVPLKFEWSPQNYAFSDIETMTFDTHPSYTTYCTNQGYSMELFSKIYGDINGDGLTDVIVKATYKKGKDEKNYWVVYLKRPDTHPYKNQYQYEYEQEWDKDKETIFLLVDSDHDGKDELYMGKYNTHTPNGFYIDTECYQYKNATMQNCTIINYLSHTVISSSDYNNRKESYIIPGDFLGNGYIQMLLFSKNNKLLRSSDFLSNIVGGDAQSRIYITDINGNGKSEIMYLVGNNSTFYEYNTSSNQFESIYTTNNFAYTDKIYPGDFNGDGNTDLLVQKTNKVNKIWVSTATSLIDAGWNNIVDPADYWSSDGKSRSKLLMDINQDGKTDVICSNFPANTSQINRLKIYINTGNGFVEKTSVDMSEQDVNHLFGNNRFDSSIGKGILTHTQYNTATLKYLNINPNTQFNKIVNITNSLGATTNISYTFLANTPKQTKSNLSDTENGSSEIQHSLPIELDVVNKVTATNVNMDYKFVNPHIHWKGKGFLGFDSIRVQDNINAIVSTTKLKLNSTFYFLYPYKTITHTTGGSKISETTSNYTITNAGNNKYFLRLDSQVSSDVLKGISGTTSYFAYDTERNPHTILTDFGNGITSTKSLLYISKGSRFLNKISYQKVTQTTPNMSNYSREEYSFYDNKGNLTYQVKDSTDAHKVQIFYNNYNQYGNPQNITTKADGIARSQSLTYTPHGRFVQSKTNHLGETTTYNWNEAKGLLNNEVDARSRTTTYQYDNWGRLTNTFYPDGLKSATALQWAGNTAGKPTGAKYYSYSETSGESPVWIWYDALGREIRKDAYRLNQNKIWVKTRYNNKGQVASVSDPYFEGTNPSDSTTYAYDTYGRIQNVVAPMGTTSYAYSGKTTTVTTPTDTKSTTINSAGRVITETTNNKSVTFTHYASGQVKTATPQGGQALTMEYDLQGNRTKLIDPDAGTITSQYNGWGQLKTEKQKIHLSADSIITNYYYHTSGLLDYKSRNDSITNYEYDNLYRLKRVSITGKHAQAYGYDQWDRIIETRDTVENNKVFIRKTEYDRLGRMYKEIYPDGYYTTNSYDTYGYLTKVSDAAHGVLWQATESNARGQLTKTQSGGRETSFGFDSRGFPTSIVTPDITNLMYYFNDKGNLEYRHDFTIQYGETFQYDNMNRLKEGKVSFDGMYYPKQEVVYHPTTGNIQTKTDLNNLTMSYGKSDGTKPHALTGIDGIPDLITYNLQMEYTDFKKVKKITKPSQAILNIEYGTDEQRIKSVLTKPGSAALTRYYMGDYEEEIQNGNVRKIHYICGGNGLAAVLVDNTLYYAHTDYQGSLIALSNTDGTVAERYAYDPWGNRRNPENWTQRDTRTTFLLNRGYTMHEHLDDFGLINMNGRVYDPLTAQFFSPDPYVQAPNNWLNYNRYSYAFGNPFRYTDPDGEFFLAAIFIGAFINTAMQGITGNLHNTGDFWKAFGIGALSGAAGAGAGSLASGAIHFGGFAGGSLIGAAGGAAGGFVGGAGNAWANGASFGNGLKSGLIGGGIGAIAGGLIGGITRGISDAKNGYDFWNGSRIDEFQIGDPLTSSENYVKQANEYNSSFEAEFDTENLQERMNRVFGIKKGNMNIQEITTQPTKGNYGLTSDGKYVKLSTGNPVGGYTITNSGDPFPRVHISPYYAKGDLVSFKVVAGHELIHAYHISVFPNFDRVYSERVAYKYSYDVLMNYGRFDSAMSLMNNAMSNSYWGASPSQYRKVPYLFFYFRF